MGSNYNNNTNNTGNNFLFEHGYGEWCVVLYDPSGSCGTFNGYLSVGKDFHTVHQIIKSPNSISEKRIILSVPSQNVSFVYDHRFLNQTTKE